MTSNSLDFAPHDVTLNPDVTLRYFHRPGDGTNLLFFHPSSGYGRMWEPTTEHLGPRFNVFALDQRGHGDSSRPDGEYSAEEYARDARAFVEKLGLKRVVVAGHSLGGRVAQVFAALYPDITEGLITVKSPHLSNFYPTRTAAQTVLTSVNQMLVSPTEFPSRAAARAAILTLFPLATDATVEHRIDHNMNHAPDGSITVKYDPVRVAQGLAHMLVDLKKYAALVRCPVAFVLATDSNELPTPESARDFVRYWTNVAVDLYSVKANNNMQMENPEGLAKAITDFVEKRL